MIRLFLTLNALIISSLIFFMLTLNKLPDVLFHMSDVDSIEYRISNGTFHLLEKEVEGLTASEIMAKAPVYQTSFGSLFDILTEDSILFLSQQDLQRLKKGKTVTHDRKDLTPARAPHTAGNMITTEASNDDEQEAPTLHYRRIPNTQLVWQLPFDLDVSLNNLTTYVFGNYLYQGTFQLIRNALKDKPEEQWQAIIQGMQTHFQIPLSLGLLESLETTAENWQSLQAGQLVNLTQTQRAVTVVQRIKNSPYYIQSGPVDIPWNIFYTGHMLFGILVLFFSTAIFIAVAPLWHNLSKLREATNLFGEGKFATRVKYSKLSSTAPISAAFNTMAERLETTIHAQKELTTAVSHELRTPIARMRFSLDMLEDSENLDDRHRYINNLNTDIEEMDLLLEELLTYARFDQHDAQVNIQSTKIKPWFNKTMEQLACLQGDKELLSESHQIDDDDLCSIDEALMSRVLNNLVQNALRYAKNTVLVTLVKSSNSNYELHVIDDGEGIPQSEHERLFDAFATLEASRNKEQQGFGMGLAIAKRIVDKHLGAIVISKSSMGGAEFTVTWPITPSNQH